MAVVAPFCGLRYNPARIPNPAEVVIPPYDVISPSQQESFYRCSPYNMIRLELGKLEPGDSGQEDVHRRAGECFKEWQREAVLIRDSEPAIYTYELDYSLEGKDLRTRYGFICRLRLEDFSKGVVLPHERTFPKTRAERQGLMHACRANLSPVFSIYSDRDSSVDRVLRAGREPEPFLSFTDQDNMTHRLWRVNDPDTLDQVRLLMLEKLIYIADGHHRYETALAYRDQQRKAFPQAGPLASFEYIMMYLSDLNQGGLTILPTHRLLRTMGDSWNPEAFLLEVEPFFEVSAYGMTPEGEAAWRRDLESGAAKKETRIGHYRRGSDQLFLFRAKKKAVEEVLSSQSIPQALRRLDVEVLDQVLLKRLSNLPEELLTNAENIHFNHDLADTLSQMRSGTYHAAFFINPTRIDQVQEVATAGLIMPHKSTYFYPKVGSGTVIHSLDPEERSMW